ncbi:MAG: hypothetical protein ACOYY3_02445 [Chloroflexota bacterium]
MDTLNNLRKNIVNLQCVVFETADSFGGDANPGCHSILISGFSGRVASQNEMVKRLPDPSTGKGNRFPGHYRLELLQQRPNSISAMS